ncbi:response regulator [Maribacter sp. X9]|uniref:response regulator n=1 Tax=Maribacter sp. X9 TaxID=3402159 RepID=UPI003AF3CE88
MLHKSRHLVALADDDIDDREIFLDVCADLNVGLSVKSFENGFELLRYLNMPDAELPSILFLDINMPIKDGFESLSEIRKKIGLTELCIIMYSTSTASKDIEKARKMEANAFLQKPSSYSKLKLIIQKILDTDWKNPCSHLDEFGFLITV